MAWAVDLERLRADIGSGDEALVRRYSEGFAERYDQMQADIDGFTGEPGAVTPADVARHMVMGEPYDERIGFAYAYFVQYLCELHGTFLDNPRMMPLAVDLPERLDKVLGDRGFLADGFSISDLLFGGSPVPLPPVNGFPGIGFREYGTLQEPAERLSWSGAADDLPDEYMGPAYDVFQWLSEAHDRKLSVVAFFH